MKLISMIAILFLSGIANAELRLENSQQVQIESSSHYYYFGQVPVNSMNTVAYTITNTGYTFLQFTSASIWGMHFDANHSCMSGLQPNQRCQFQLRYWPYTTGYHSGQFEIQFRGPTPNPEVIHVDLRGEAVHR